MFKPEKPIEKTSDDLLGRVSFSNSFAQAILNYSEKDSIVTSIYGDWGSGKSSVINMSLQIIEENSVNLSKDEKPIIVNFNPWNYSDQSHLIALFFKELSFALRREDYGEEAKKAGEKLEVYANFFTPLALIPDPTVSMISLLTQKVFKGVGKSAKAWGAAYSKDIEATRSELNSLLDKQKRKIIIVIDDIDRLTNDEIRQIFQLVKILGDFPNTIYVLAFDRNVVVKALAKVQEGCGYDYLEKIVQFPVEIPSISKFDLDKIFFKSLDEIVKEIPEEKWDNTHWGNIYHSGVKHYLKTIRDVIRYINTFKFAFEMVRDDVNPVDFIAITTLQVFEPDLYSGIRENKNLFSGILENGINSIDADKKQTTARFDEILNRTQLLNNEILKDFLGRLFPKIEGIYGNMNYGTDFMESWRKESRICHPQLFDIYFSLSIPPGEISKNEVKSILDLANNSEIFKKALIDLLKEGRIVRFLELMEDYTDDYIDEKNIQNTVSVIMDIGDSFPESKSGLFDLGTDWQIHRIFRQLSFRLEQQEQRFNLFKTAIQDTEKSLFTIVHKVGMLGSEHRKSTSEPNKQLKPEDQREINSLQLEELETLAAEKISIWADSGQLIENENFVKILYSWQRWDKYNPNISKQYVNKLIGTDEGLIKLITAFAKQTTFQSFGDHVTQTQLKINLENLNDFVDIKNIEPRIRKIQNSKDFKGLEINQQNAINIFIDTFDGKVDDF